MKKIWLAFYCLCLFAVAAEAADNVQDKNQPAFNFEQTISPELPLEYSYLQDVVEITYTKLKMQRFIFASTTKNQMQMHLAL